MLRSEDSLKQIHAVAQKQRNAAAANYERNQLAIIKKNKELGGNKLNGFGRKSMEVDLATYMHWAAVDTHFWDDPSNIKKLRMNNKELWVK